MSSPDTISYSVPLKGLDGTNPLGFLAALGTLVVAREIGATGVCIRWVLERTWTPILDGLRTSCTTEFCARVAENLSGQSVAADAAERRAAAEKAHSRARTAVNKERNEIKKLKIRLKADREKAIEERVRPLEAIADAKRADWLKALKAAVPRPELALGARIDCTGAEYRDHAAEFIEGADSAEREAIQYLAAFGSDACLETGKGDFHGRQIDATPFCFIRGSGHQNFLDTVRKLLAQATTERVAQALFEPWRYRDPGLSMRWDPGEDKRYALMDVKPAEEGALTVWMANLLAYRSLALFPCAPTRSRLGTTAWTDVEGDRVFTWPLWEFAAAPDTVRTMLQLRELREVRRNRTALDGRGIAAVFCARRVRFPRKGASYKLSFSPACQVFQGSTPR